MTCDTWHVTPDTWHVTHDKWHVSRDTQEVMNIASKFQVPSSYGLCVYVSWRFWTKGSPTQWINQWITKVFIEHPRVKLKAYKWIQLGTLKYKVDLIFFKEVCLNDFGSAIACRSIIMLTFIYSVPILTNSGLFKGQSSIGKKKMKRQNQMSGKCLCWKIRIFIFVGIRKIRKTRRNKLKTTINIKKKLFCNSRFWRLKPGKNNFVCVSKLQLLKHRNYYKKTLLLTIPE